MTYMSLHLVFRYDLDIIYIYRLFGVSEEQSPVTVLHPNQAMREKPIILLNASLQVKNVKLRTPFSVSMGNICVMFVQRFGPRGRRFTNSFTGFHGALRPHRNHTAY